MCNVQLLQGTEFLISHLYIQNKAVASIASFITSILRYSDTKLYLNGDIFPMCFLFHHNQKAYVEVAVCDKIILEPLGLSDQN